MNSTDKLLVVVFGLVLAYLFYRIESRIDNLESRFESRFDNLESRFESRFDNLESRFDNLEGGFNNLNTTMNNGFIFLINSIASVIDTSHNLAKFTMEVAKKCTEPIEACRGQHGTAHAVHYKGRFAVLTVSHFKCGGKVPEQWIASESADLALIQSCPSNGFAMEVTNSYANLEMTDQVLAFGKALVWEGRMDNNAFEDRVWIGNIAGKYGLNSTASPFDGSCTILPHEYVTNSVQEGAMSGAAALNGCGYLGLVHAQKLSYSQAVVLPYTEIFQFLDDHFDKLLTPEQCAFTKVLEIPIAFGKLCNRA